MAEQLSPSVEFGAGEKVESYSPLQDPFHAGCDPASYCLRGVATRIDEDAIVLDNAQVFLPLVGWFPKCSTETATLSDVANVLEKNGNVITVYPVGNPFHEATPSSNYRLRGVLSHVDDETFVLEHVQLMIPELGWFPKQSNERLTLLTKNMPPFRQVDVES